MISRRVVDFAIIVAALAGMLIGVSLFTILNG